MYSRSKPYLMIGCFRRWQRSSITAAPAQQEQDCAQAFLPGLSLFLAINRSGDTAFTNWVLDPGLSRANGFRWNGWQMLSLRPLAMQACAHEQWPLASISGQRMAWHGRLRFWNSI